METEFDNLFLTFRILCPLMFVSKYFAYFSNYIYIYIYIYIYVYICIYILTNVVGLHSLNFLKSILKLILKPNFNRFSPALNSLS